MAFQMVDHKLLTTELAMTKALINLLCLLQVYLHSLTQQQVLLQVQHISSLLSQETFTVIAVQAM